MELALPRVYVLERFLSKPLEKSFLVNRLDDARIDRRRGVELQDFRASAAHLGEGEKSGKNPAQEPFSSPRRCWVTLTTSQAKSLRKLEEGFKNPQTCPLVNRRAPPCFDVLFLGRE